MIGMGRRREDLVDPWFVAQVRRRALFTVSLWWLGGEASAVLLGASRPGPADDNPLAYGEQDVLLGLATCLGLPVALAGLGVSAALVVARAPDADSGWRLGTAVAWPGFALYVVPVVSWAAYRLAT
ncbi:hypothetical protein Acy02nite_26400 [Actinoplanes cyaneus]|uniref:Uncharacterized protein n=1 Tax=Actinoplanes cyaneus TaxID=52696 RepID=A0A919M6U4_9ACTN|nr:hypothetical protein [Actinoplanes cyaneus]MCW2138033.1 hypothetical protein [Actinoplanes cyaneus]GID64759.1 hypothetical protein Acy02nite_26400 [Actinoplanes cyaneus]